VGNDVSWNREPPGRPYLRFGLRAKLFASFIAFAVGLAFVAIATLVSLERLEAQLESSRVVPIGELKSISDRYAIDVVDTVHKVCSRHLSPEAGGVLVARARKASQESWQAVTPGSASANDALLRASERLLEKADHAAERAQELMFRADLEGLESFRSKEMYGEIEPLTASLQALIFTEMERSDALMADTVSRLSAFRSSAAIALSVVCVLSLLLALWLPRRFAASLSKIEGVVRRVAAGDLPDRIQVGDGVAAKARGHLHGARPGVPPMTSRTPGPTRVWPPSRTGIDADAAEAVSSRSHGSAIRSASSRSEA
jgi:methyl-accepting chemotaxis protein